MSPFSKTSVFLAAAAAVAALGLASGALAQDNPAPPAMGPAQHHDGDRAEWRKAHEERRAGFLRDVLNIRPDQEPALQAFLADMRPPHDHMDGAEDKGAMDQALTTPERLDRMAAMMAKHQAAFQHRADAVKRFYAVLSPEQKRAFDALHGMGRMGGMGHGMRGMDGHRGGPDEGPGGMDHHGGEGEAS